MFQPEKKRRKRDGYADGDYTLFKAISATDFVKAPDPIAVLGTANQLTFKSDDEKEFVVITFVTHMTLIVVL